jgi:hypothetical protein
MAIRGLMRRRNPNGAPAAAAGWAARAPCTRRVNAAAPMRQLPGAVGPLSKRAVSQAELLKLHRAHVMHLDVREAGQGREGHHAPTGLDPLWRPQRSLPFDLFPHERGAAPPVRQLCFEPRAPPRPNQYPCRRGCRLQRPGLQMDHPLWTFHAVEGRLTKATTSPITPLKIRRSQLHTPQTLTRTRT